MKKFIVLFLVFFIALGCTKNNKELRLTEQLDELKDSNENLSKKLDSINNLYIIPFKLYESIVIREYESSPETSINRYHELINRYPNSFWKHESEKRIENIEKRKKYWTEKDGWRFDNIPKKPTYDEQVISCPGR